jgi:hypothetical protein
MIHLISSPATPRQMKEMLEELEDLVKLAVDIERWMLAGGAELHADCEEALLADGSNQQDVWGATWFSTTGHIKFESAINLRPRQKNFSMEIQDEAVRGRVEAVIKDLLESL